MRGLRRLGTRTAGIGLLVVLLLVPLALSTHGHAAHHDARPCAVCVVAHHSPAIATATVAVTSAFVAAVTPVVVGLALETRAAHSVHSGRAPPRAALTFAA
jgi:hypothetical protein